jgi:N-acetyl-alpha-D-glucosaminyl L-malate synthase BshA
MEFSPLKIGIACFPLIGGSGILATALGSELARRGHEVYFFSYAQPVRLDLPQEGLHFHRVEVVHNALFPCPDYTLPLAVKMAEVARSQQLDLFHVHYAVPHALAACLASQMVGPLAPRIVTTLHGTDTTLLGQDPDYRTAIEYALVHSDAVTAVSESLRQQTQEIFRLQRHIEVIPNFFTPTKARRGREEVRRDLGITDEFLVLHMSSLRPVKRIDLLLRTIALSKRRDRLRLLILAGGSFAPYEPLLDELELRDRVIVRQNTAVVDEYLEAADAGLYTSEYESFGLGILETLFYGRPVVAFRVGGIPDVVGDCSPLYAFGDLSAMAAALDALVKSPNLARELGERGRDHAIERFSAARIIPQYEALYRRIVSSRSNQKQNSEAVANHVLPQLPPT